MELQKFLSLIDQVIDGKTSDLHITPDDFPYVRNKVGEIVAVEEFGVVSKEDIAEICQILLSRPFTEKTVDVSFEYRDTRFRVNISHILK